MKRIIVFTMILCILFHIVWISRVESVGGIGDLVWDPAVFGQVVISAVNTIQIATNTAQEVVNSYEILKAQVAQVQAAVQNLKRFDVSLSPMIFTLGSNLTTILRNAGGVSFTLTQAMSDFDQLYTQAQAHSDVVEVRSSWLQSRISAARTATSLQAISADLPTVYGRLCELLVAARSAPGALSAEQIQAQQEGLSQAIQLQQSAMIATSQRVQAQREAEDAAQQQMQLQAIQEALQPAPAYTGTQGTLTNYKW